MSKDQLIVLLQREIYNLKQQLEMQNEQHRTLSDQYKLQIDALLAQLKVSNETNISLQNTITSLKETVSNLEKVLLSKDKTLTKANSQLKQVNALYAPKKLEKQIQSPTPKSPEQIAKDEQARKEAIKARGNNGAKRKDYF